MGRRKHKFNRQVAPMCQHGKAYGRYLANTIEPPVCGGLMSNNFDHLLKNATTHRLKVVLGRRVVKSELLNIKATFHYAIHVADLVCDLVADL